VCSCFIILPSFHLDSCVHLCKRYLGNFYHNLWHGADVCFTTWRLLHDTKCVEWMTQVEVFAALVAAYGHDVGHPGVGNPFLVQTGSDLALLHNDHSPLENMHAAILAGVRAMVQRSTAA